MTTESSSPRILVCETREVAARRVAGIIADAIRQNPRIVLGLATGGTPIGVYRELVRMHREEGLDFSEVTTFNLDEYVGLAPEHPQSFFHFMREHLFDHINVPAERIHLPDGLSTDIAAHASDYEQQIRAAGGIELQLLGIGSNGHIAFNEPGSPPDGRTCGIDLTEDTIRANARFFESVDDVPRRAITMGIGTILDARRIVLMATGEGKAETITRTVEGVPDASHPASLLQRHDDVTIVLDRAAASGVSGQPSGVSGDVS